MGWKFKIFLCTIPLYVSKKELTQEKWEVLDETHAFLYAMQLGTSLQRGKMMRPRNNKEMG